MRWILFIILMWTVLLIGCSSSDEISQQMSNSDVDTDSDTDSDTDNDTDLLDDGAYFRAGDWVGYAYTEVGTTAGGTVSELNADWTSGDGTVCITGQLVADYNSLGVLGMSVAQLPGSSDAVSWSTSGYSGVYVDVTKNIDTEIRLELLTSGDTYCAVVPSGGVTLSWSDFATECWGTGGTPYTGDHPFSSVQLYAPGSIDGVVDYDYCLNALYPVTNGTDDTDTGSDTDSLSGEQCAEADEEICEGQSGIHCGYNYEFWSDQKVDCMTLKSGGNFAMTWKGEESNVLARKGRRPGTGNELITYSADYTADGTSYLSVYGWLENVPTPNPGDYNLVEYYIVESWVHYNPSTGGDPFGTFQTSDGATYTLSRSVRKGSASIDGNRDFYQYWSVRNNRRTSGTVNVAEHFQAWQDANLPLGDLYEVSFVVEGFESTGSGDVVMSIN